MPSASIKRAASSSVRSRRSGSPAPANTTDSNAPCAPSRRLLALTTARYTSSAQGSNSSANGTKPLPGGRVKPGPRELINETLLHRFVRAT
ncbi:hypothetical protein AB1Y20_014918 [Prymnesium parvum]|uniref:Uncharacterized protein n=1 Tax=Prymnesium parvum TaxID=97485 RepID=A0AB34JWX1_PRYPA